MINAKEIKKDFPILARKVHNKPLVYLDNSASSQKPIQVIDAIANYYKTSHANVHRGVHQLGEEATIAYEKAHKATARFINAVSWREIIFTKNATESLNLLAYSITQTFQKGEEIIVSRKEHHSNFVPWQQAAKRHKLTLKICDIKEDGTLDIAHLKSLLNKKTRIVSISHMSNVLGVANDIKGIAAVVHRNVTSSGHTVLSIDGAQSVPHLPVDVQELDCDFLSFSGHKMCGPTGIGIFYGKKELLQAMPPFLMGGGMVGEVTEEVTTWGDIPWKFEAGTPNVAGAVGLTAAILYLEKIGMKNVWKHSKELAKYAIEQLKKHDDITMYGPTEAEEKSAVIAFNINNIHAHDVISILDKEGIACRAGHHCAQPLMDHMNVKATVRLSAYIYNTKEDIDALMRAIQKVREVFA
jgi:cysteine desulfurase / selenocysteine lyase